MLHPIMDDPQDRSAEAYCQHCGAELWGSDAEPDCGGKTLCPQCREDLAETEHRKEMITAVLEAADQETKSICLMMCATSSGTGWFLNLEYRRPN